MFFGVCRSPDAALAEYLQYSLPSHNAIFCTVVMFVSSCHLISSDYCVCGNILTGVQMSSIVEEYSGVYRLITINTSESTKTTVDVIIYFF